MTRNQDTRPVRWMGGQAIVTLPEQIDVTNAGQIREELLLVINQGAAALIADMTATVSCDHAGADAVVRAYQRAVVNGIQLRLVVTAQIVRRVLSINGLDRLIPIYPCLEAAVAAGGPAPVIPVAPGAVGPRNWSGGAAGAAAVLRELIDALADGVALTDDAGILALANRRLEEMFGYEHAELIGQPVESLVPADLRTAHRSHRAPYAQALKAGPMGARAGLVGLRRDGTTFPVEISLSPVPTATGRFTLAVVRDITERTAPVILEALIPGGTQGDASAAEVPEKLRERAVGMVFEVRDRDGKGCGELAQVARQNRRARVICCPSGVATPDAGNSGGRGSGHRHARRAATWP